MTLYVGNIAFNMTGEELQSVFSPYGKVNTSKIIIDKRTGRSKGYGFVEMENDRDGYTAIDELNGREVKGRTIKVSKANPRQE
jgi:RNA recognition motif-containing protein